MPKESIQKQQLFELLKTFYGINAQSVELIPFAGADMNAFAYKVDAGCKSYFIKLKYNHYDETYISIIRLLQDSGIKEIIFPIHTTDGQLFSQIDHIKMIVYPFVEGQNVFNQNLTKEQWVQLGKAFKKIHTLSIPFPIQQQLRKETFSTKWREIVRSLYRNIEPDTSDDKITANFKNFFKKNINAIHRLVDSAEELSRKIPRDSNTHVLCHSDIHAGNVLITSEGSLYIIDWDDPMIAAKERDLMFIGGGIGNTWNTAQEVSDFYEGYGETKLDNILLSYYRYERIVEDIALFGQDLLSQELSKESKIVSFEHFKSMFEPNGVIEIAFND